MMILFWYLIVINLFGFGIMWLDKRRAIRQQWRIPEATLHLVAWLGGGPLMLVARQKIRHKSQKLGFLISFGGASIVWGILSILSVLIAMGIITILN
ncbi:MAG: DUF1294 domain-containing protein [Culicoidibacterales bacterium]